MCDDKHGLWLSSDLCYLPGVTINQAFMRPWPLPQYSEQVISNVPASFGVSSTFIVVPPAGMRDVQPELV